MDGVVTIAVACMPHICSGSAALESISQSDMFLHARHMCLPELTVHWTLHLQLS